MAASGSLEEIASALSEFSWPKQARLTGHVLLWIRRRCLPPGGLQNRSNPTDRGKSGTKRHLLVERQCIPLAITTSAANVHDVRMLEATEAFCLALLEVLRAAGTLSLGGGADD